MTTEERYDKRDFKSFREIDTTPELLAEILRITRRTEKKIDNWVLNNRDGP
jgi:hypothetical protein